MLRKRVVGVVAAGVVVVLGAGCSGAGDEVVDAAVTAVATVEPSAAATVQPEAKPAATAEPEPAAVVMSDGELIEAALAIYAGTEEAAGYVSYELVSGFHRFDGLVDLDLCTWDGRSVDSVVRTARVQVDGPGEGHLVSEAFGPGTCVSDGLMVSALEFIEFYDNLHTEMVADPASFDSGPWADIMADRLYEQTRDAQQRHAEDGTYWIAAKHPGVDYPGELEEDVAWRLEPSSYAGRAIELVLCLPMNEQYGLYREGQLLEGGREEPVNTQTIHYYQLVALEDRESSWQMANTANRVWGDCDRGGSWLDNVDAWRPEGRRWVTWSHEQG